MNKYYNIVRKKDFGEILIYGIIGDYWEDDCTASSFAKDFKALEVEYDTIHVHINSCGGVINEGLGIANTIKNSGKNVTVYVDGYASSMGAIIAISAPKTIATKGSLFMLHSASTLCWGNRFQFADEIESLKKHDEILASMIAEKTGKTTDEIKSLYFDGKEHWFTPDEAKEIGLVNEIDDKKAAAVLPKQNASMKEIRDFLGTLNIPAGTADLSTTIDRILAGIKNIFDKPKFSENMIKKFSNLLNCEATEDAVFSAVEALVSELKKVTDELKTANEQLAALQTEKTNLTAERDAKTTEVTGLTAKVEKLIVDLANAASGKPATSNAGDKAPGGEDYKATDPANEAAKQFV
jgi:ATP-dependent protease ClpP protease subunit